MNTLMLHSSPAFKAAFNAKLFEQLAAVAEQREHEEEEARARGSNEAN